MNLFDQMLARYPIQSEDDQINATREIMQQIALSGLYRSGFFNKAAFYEGTCLRIFHGSDRFSEDMDFSLITKEPEFDLNQYFESLIKEFLASGRDITIVKKVKKQQSTIESAFLKENTQLYDLQFSTQKSIKIKIEVDIDPPGKFETEYKLLLMPFSFMTRCFTLPSLFAGKMHALLYRSWKNRVKGRDWYDLVWYVKHNVPLDIRHFFERAKQSNHLQDYPKQETIKQLIREKIGSTSIEMIKNDIRPFIKNPGEIKIYSVDFFHQLINMIKWQG